MSSAVPPLSLRLAALAAAIAPGSRVADIGTDHGRLPLWLVATGRAAYCLATEKSGALLSRVARPDGEAPWASRLVYRAGDGLSAIRVEDGIDTIVIAGVGGRAMTRMLAAPPGLPPRGRLVLQPRSELPLVRLWLSGNGWRLVSERMTRERGRAHVTLAAEPGDDAALYADDTLSRDDLLAAGPLLVRSGAEEVTAAWTAERLRLASILSGDASGGAILRARKSYARAGRILAAICRRAG